MFEKSITAALLGAVAAVAAGMALAVDLREPAVGYAEAGEFRSATVTARHRPEEEQVVPIAMSVFTADRLMETGSSDFSRLQQMLPSLQYYSSNPRNSQITIRGLGAPFGLSNDGVEQGVGLYVDDVYYSRAAASALDFVDIDRVEVLRGPQGALYGKGASAGVINVITRGPTFTPTAVAELSAGSFGFVQAKAAISGPIIGASLAGRLAVSVTRRDGLIENVRSGQDIDALDNLGVRGQLLWRVNDDLDVSLAGDYNTQNPECCGQLYVRVGVTQRPLSRQYGALAAAQNYVVPSTNPFDRVTDLDAPMRAENELGGASLRATWRLFGGELTSVTAWRYWDWSSASDRDFTGLPITINSEDATYEHQWSHELRFAHEGRRFDYLLGLFGFRESMHTAGVQRQGPAASRWLIEPGNPASLNPAVLNGLSALNDTEFGNTSGALFGQLTWLLGERWRIEPGMRVSYEQKSGSYVSSVSNVTGTALSVVQRAVLSPQAYTAKVNNFNVSGHFKLSYALSANTFTYVSAARSVKTAGITLNGVPRDVLGNPLLADVTVKPERANHLELGLKSELYDHKATLSLAGFWTNVTDYQASVSNGQLVVLRGYLAKAEKAQVRGIEADLSIRAGERVSAYLNAALTDGKLTTFSSAPCSPELSGGTRATAANPPSPPGTPGGFSAASCNLSGTSLPGVSRVALAAGARYGHPVVLFGVSGTAYLGVDGSYRSQFSSNTARSVYTDIDSYALANLRLGFRAEQGWEVFAWVRNVLDEEYFEQLSVPAGNTGLIVGQPGDSRTFGLTVQGKFSR